MLLAAVVLLALSVGSCLGHCRASTALTRSSLVNVVAALATIALAAGWRSAAGSGRLTAMLQQLRGLARACPASSSDRHPGDRERPPLHAALPGTRGVGPPPPSTRRVGPVGAPVAWRSWSAAGRDRRAVSGALALRTDLGHGGAPAADLVTLGVAITAPALDGPQRVQVASISHAGRCRRTTPARFRPATTTPPPLWEPWKLSQRSRTIAATSPHADGRFWGVSRPVAHRRSRMPVDVGRGGLRTATPPVISAGRAPTRPGGALSCASLGDEQRGRRHQPATSRTRLREDGHGSPSPRRLVGWSGRGAPGWLDRGATAGWAPVLWVPVALYTSPSRRVGPAPPLLGGGALRRRSASVAAWWYWHAMPF